MAQSSVASGIQDGTAISVFLDSTYPSNRHVFLQPSPLLPAGSLQLAKQTLDDLADQVVDQQQARVREVGKKRKWESSQTTVLKLRKLHIEGFETGQVWQQARKIITSALQESTQLLQELEEGDEVEQASGDNAEHSRIVEFGEDGFEVGSDAESASASSQSGSEADGEDTAGEASDSSGEEDINAILEEEEADEGREEEKQDDSEEEEVADEFVEDPDGLNDGFFSLEDFNKQTQWFEARDAQADPNTDHFSDEESVDWHADPFSLTEKGNSKGVNDDDDDDEDEEESDVDMDELENKKAPPASGKDAFGSDESEGQLEDDLGDLEMDLTANDIFYKDFFAPPPKKKKPGSFRGKKSPFEQLPAQPEEVDIERAQNDVRRDLFDDLSERSGSEDALSDVSAGNPKSRRSAHERRQAKVAEEIRKLEAELVAKRAWTLSGEAAAADRPVNSLLEEDLEFEHVGKPVPVITEEVSESIESLIKRRILAQEFDELLRRRPDTLGNPNAARRGLVDVQDTKGKQSLAEIYEEEHAKKSNPDAYVSQADEKLRRDEEEIKQMWKDISAKLDALSSWHYKPKPSTPTLTIVADVATVAMEDAQPTTAQGVAGGESMIAPQEVYAPGKDSTEQGEVVAKSGLPVARQEMSREEKLRRRRREKERIRKAGGLDATKSLSKKAQAQKETMDELKRGGVKVINRKGEIMGLDGKKVSDQKGARTSGGLKL